MPGIAKVRIELVGTATAVDFAPMQREELAAAHLAVPGEAAVAVAQSSKGSAAAASAPAGPRPPAQHRAQVALAATATVGHVGSGGSGPTASAPLGDERAVDSQAALKGSGPPGAGHGQPAQAAGKATESSPSPSFPSRLTLQVGAFRDAGNAARLERLLAANGFAPRAERAGEVTRVLIPQIRTSDLAPTKKRLASLGITTVFVRTE